MTTETAVSSDYIEALATLQVRNVDAANGFRTGIAKAEKNVQERFRELADMHERFSADLSNLLVANGQKPDLDGSWFSLVHETIMSVRGFFDQLDEDALKQIASGEQQIIDQYDKALKHAPDDGEAKLLRDQKAELTDMVALIDG